jgi:membrane protein implicated in regulation of membrane protease activity
VGATQRRTLPIPYGHHVYVVSDLSISPTTDVKNRPMNEFIDLLGEIDDAAAIVVAGNFFHPGVTTDFAQFIEATFAALPALRDAITSFVAGDSHQFIVLPGTDDAELRSNERAQTQLESLGISLASDLILQVATANDVRDLAVAAGSCCVDKRRADLNDQADADRLEDPLALPRFVASRVLYRRLGAWVWIPVVALLLFDLFGAVSSIMTHFTHERLKVHTPHTHTFWGNLLVNILIVVFAEAIVAGIATLIVRRRFDRGARHDAPELSEPLSLTHVDDVDALEFARRNAEHGGAGAVVGGAPRPALAFLDRGVCASPGPSRTVLVERRGRFGLPPVFTSVDRLGIVEIEAASAVQVRLYAGESPRRRARLLERLVADANVQPAPSKETSTVGSWPTGDPFPVTVERLRDQRRQRTVRRWTSGLLFVGGLINVVVTAFPPLHRRLHTVLTVLPLGAAESAAALTAVAGIAMIMTARGIRRGQRRAWFLAVGVLAVTIVAHLVRGGTVLASLFAAGILLLLVVGRRYFQATTDRSSVRAALPRLGLITLVTVAAATLSIEASQHRHHLPSLGVVIAACVERLVGINSITLPDRVGDFVNPTLLAVGFSIIVSAFYVLTRPVVDRRLSTTSRSAERRFAELRAREIVRRHGRGTLDYFALRDDKQFYFFRYSLVA